VKKLGEKPKTAGSNMWSARHVFSKLREEDYPKGRPGEGAYYAISSSIIWKKRLRRGTFNSREKKKLMVRNENSNSAWS